MQVTKPSTMSLWWVSITVGSIGTAVAQKIVAAVKAATGGEIRG